MKLPKVKVRKLRRPAPTLPAQQKPQAGTGREEELLTGVVQGMKASAPEERLFVALGKLNSVEAAQFRYTVGAPRGLPGWKEIDALVAARGTMYAVEVDTAFTHREKGRADVLHDAIVLEELRKEGMNNVYPSVIHLDGETDLADQKWADNTARRFFA